MTSKEIRQKFLDYFESKDHLIVDSAPIVNKDDPTLMFTNAGMNQFKDYFLGNQVPKSKRIADTQKCLRASGKHNDLDDVGLDHYHHTMFEMLGNWSFGDYFKEESIAWAWELITEVYGLPADRLYATVFSGDEKDGLGSDDEAAQIWKKYLPEDRILYFDRKDNFWEMGDQGPAGPCSELHIDLRTGEEKSSAADLVNMDHPEVIEIWNLVFIQYNRKADGKLEALPENHVDTGMGFERVVRAIQKKGSNYDTDVFTPIILEIEKLTDSKYGGTDSKEDMAVRVVADHLRAVSFTISDGQLPSNSGAGYVVRRILRRAVRYYYSFLDYKQPLIHQLVRVLTEEMGDVFEALRKQQAYLEKIILEEEKSFLKTLGDGLGRFAQIEVKDNVIAGQAAFELYDTFGFPYDLTEILAKEKGYSIDREAFQVALTEQQERSRADAVKDTGDWIEVNEGAATAFIGYDDFNADVSMLKYRTVEAKGKKQFHVVLDRTPFYPEGGGQVGDKGTLSSKDSVLNVVDTKKENELIIHVVDKNPEGLSELDAKIDLTKRQLTENNHTATHLMHAALRAVLGDHVEQRGSLVNDQYLRFDFSHFSKVGAEELEKVERLVNQKVRENIALLEDRSIPIEQAKERGAMMLFGEKYDDDVRMITFDPAYSVELCGGCHVDATGKIGLFKITTETSVASGVRRIEAVTGKGAEEWVAGQLAELNSIKGLFKNPTSVVDQVAQLQEENKGLNKQLAKAAQSEGSDLKEKLLQQVETIGDLKFLATRVPITDQKVLKTLAFQLKTEVENSMFIFATEQNEKPMLLVALHDNLVAKGLDAGAMIRELAQHIKGGGGGQPFFATAGGKDVSGIDAALEAAKKFAE